MPVWMCCLYEGVGFKKRDGGKKDSAKIVKNTKRAKLKDSATIFR